jgi:hypothetical protein
MPKTRALLVQCPQPQGLAVLAAHLPAVGCLALHQQAQVGI